MNARSASRSDARASPAMRDAEVRALVERHVDDVGRDLAERAARAGLAVTLADGTHAPIPIAAVPIVLDDAEIERRAAIARDLAAATAKAARWRMRGEERDAVLRALGPTERRLVAATWDGPDELAVARVDFMGAQALEVNATIPAMQAYSDIAAAAWIETFAAGRADARELVAANGSNADALLASLLALHRHARGGDPRRVALLCRRRDAQSTELSYLRGRWARTVPGVRIAHPEDVRDGAGGFLVHDGERIDLVYRHLFLSRLDAQASPALEARIAAGPGAPGTLVLNRPAPHLEMKSTLATLSRAADDDALAGAVGLDAHERAIVRAHVPLTRMLVRADPALVEEVAASQDEFVLKRSWSYGGSEVYVGRALRDAAAWRRVQRQFPAVSRWDELVHEAARDHGRGGFLVQRAVERTDMWQFLCTPAAIERTRAVVDYAAFASIGSTPAWGGVSRAAASDVVNIVGGGAVVPVIRASVAARLLG
ncbi:MAG TPA: hypothetical protein VFL14_07375 [Xanthomonadales bacterium]|nr:hypothetical protein [Xanthomonadales bacterium]